MFRDYGVIWVLYWGFIGIMERKMETTIKVHRVGLHDGCSSRLFLLESLESGYQEIGGNKTLGFAGS